MADGDEDIFGDDIYGAAPSTFGEGEAGTAAAAPASTPAAPAAAAAPAVPPAPYFAPAYPTVRNAVAEGAAAAEVLDLNEKCVQIGRERRIGFCSLRWAQTKRNYDPSVFPSIQTQTPPPRRPHSRPGSRAGRGTRRG